MRCLWMVACVLMFGAPMLVFGVDEAKVIRATFSEVSRPAQPPADPTARAALERIDVVAEARPVQTDVKLGLVVDVTLSNRGASAVEIRDPVDFLQVQVTDSRGYPVGLRPLATGGLRPKSAGPSVNDPASRTPKPYDIVAVDGQAVKPPSGLTPPTPTVRLDAGKSRRLTLRIDKILAHPEEYHAQLRRAQSVPARDPNTAVDPPAVVAIPTGNYGVKLWIALVPMTNVADGRRLETEPISIRLTAPDK